MNQQYSEQYEIAIMHTSLYC